MAGQPILALVSLVLLAGAIVMQFFIILSGAVNGSPLNKVYFLQASTGGVPIQGLPGTSRVAWTYFSLCPIMNDQTSHCRGPQAAFPFDPQNNFNLGDNTQKLPTGFINTKYYYYMSRFAWAFFLIALVFAVISLFTGLLALCSRIGGFLSGLTTCLAVLFQGLAAALMTAWTVKGRDALNNFSGYRGQKAELGKYAYGFAWGAFAALFICTVLFCVSGTLGKKKDTTTYESKGGFFGRKRSTRSRDGVKSEYS